MVIHDGCMGVDLGRNDVAVTRIRRRGCNLDRKSLSHDRRRTPIQRQAQLEREGSATSFGRDQRPRPIEGYSLSILSSSTTLISLITLHSGQSGGNRSASKVHKRINNNRSILMFAAPYGNQDLEELPRFCFCTPLVPELGLWHRMPWAESRNLGSCLHFRQL